MSTRIFSLSILFASSIAPALADEARVAVAANFARPAEMLVEQFELSRPHRIELVFGSSAKIYAQARNGAPFDAFLSADQEKPRLLAETGLAAAHSLRAYATGRLVLWTAEPERDIGRETLAANPAAKLAVANPGLAPYGLAAREVIDNLGLGARLAGSLVMGENISQVYQFVATGNAPLGFVALSQVGRNGAIERGSGWLVPTELHSPIRQYAVLLREDNIAASAFLEFLRGPEARRVIYGFGYVLDDAEP